jgi:hypothetical protein
MSTDRENVGETKKIVYKNNDQMSKDRESGRGNKRARGNKKHVYYYWSY